MIASVSIHGLMDRTTPLSRPRQAGRWIVLAAAAGLLGCPRADAQQSPTETPVPPAVDVAPAASPVEPPRVLYPAMVSPPVATPGAARAEPGLSSLATSLLVLLAVCAAAWWLLRRGTRFSPAGKAPRKLVVSESRSLGNRQFLVVVEYERERVLLGITPGKIDYLCPLPLAGAPTGSVFEERLS